MKKLNLTKLVLITSLSVLLFNCEKDSENIVETSQDTIEKSVHVCIDKRTTNDSKGASLKNVQWKSGQTIRVKFLNGSNYMQSNVKKYAKEWEQYANIKFEWVSSNSSANIKIAFNQGAYRDPGNWSYMGTDSNKFNHSMNFGEFNDNTPSQQFRGTTLHEFGHALGLIHEHSSPVSGVKWNKPVVYAYYAGYPNYWDKDKVDYNIFGKYNTIETNYTAYDSKSIMHYYVPAEHTTNGVAVYGNNTLSATDKSFIGTIYPFSTTNPTGDKCDGIPAYNYYVSYSVGNKVTSGGSLFELTYNGWKHLGYCGSTNRIKSNTKIVYPPFNK